jgi:hypothetical protein
MCNNGVMMKEFVVRIRISDDVYKKYKHFCIDNDLSIPKQTEALIKNFINVQECNNEIRKTLKNLKD